MTDRDLETLIVCAFRYAIGRMTYMPSEVRRIARDNVRVIASHMLEQFINDISSAYDHGRLGMNCDVQGWLAFGCLCRMTIDERSQRVYVNRNAEVPR
jgi:hypothetical protein